MECKENVIAKGTTPILVFDFPKDILVSDLKECIIRVESPSYSLERLLESRSVTIEPDKNRIVLLLNEEDTAGFKYMEYADVQLKILYKNIIRVSYIEQAVIGRTLDFGAGAVNTFSAKFGDCINFDEESQYFKLNFGAGYPDEVIRTDNYNDLKDKPQINGVTVEHNHNGDYYKLVDKVNYDIDQQNQDEAIENNAQSIQNLSDDLSNYKVQISLEQEAQNQSIENNANNIDTLNTNLSEYKLKIQEEQEAQDNNIQANADGIKQINNNFDEYKTQIQKEQENQDTKIDNLNTDLKQYKAKVAEEQKTQDTNIEAINTDLAQYKENMATEQQAQDAKIQANTDAITKGDSDLEAYKKQMALDQQAQDEKTQAVKTDLNEFKEFMQVDQNRQDASIQANTELANTKVDQSEYETAELAQNEVIKKNTDNIALVEENLNNYKKENDAKNLEQDSAIQANADNFANYDTTIVNDEKLAKKVDKLTQEAKDIEQDTAINKNKEDIATLNQTLDTYKKEVTKGFQDERELSQQEHKEAIDLANEKAVIDDLNLSNETTFSSLESAERFTCEKTYQGASVTIRPIEDYPIKVLANIKAVQREDGYYVGWQNVDVTQDNGGTHQVYNQQLNQPCFEGTYEFAKGKLTITSVSKDINGTEDGWEEIKLTNGRKHQFVLRNYITNSSNDLTKQLCNKYNVPVEMPAPDFNGVWIKDNALYVGGQIADVYNTLQDWKNFLASNSFQVVYGLQNSVVENYEPKIIKGQVGVNTLYANSGDITVTTHVLPLCDGDVDVDKEYVDQKDLELQLQIDKKANSSDIKTKLSEFENDVPFATVKSVETMGENTLTSANSYTDGKVEPKADKEWVIGELSKKANDVDIPSAVSQLQNDLKFQTEDDVKRAIQGLGNVFEFKGAKERRADLDSIPMSERTIGDVWFVEELSVGFIWLQDTKGQLKWEKFGSEVELKEYVKKTDIVQTTGTSTEQIMSQNAVTEQLKLKANASELANKQDKLTAEQLANINAVPNKANKDYVDGELKTKANKDYVDEQLGNKANKTDLTDKVTTTQLAEALKDKVTDTELATILENYIQKGEIPQGVLTEEDLNRILGEKNYQNADQVKATKVDNAGTADVAKNAQKLGEKTLEQLMADVKATKVDGSSDSDKLGGKLAEEFTLKSELPTDHIKNAGDQNINGVLSVNGLKVTKASAVGETPYNLAVVKTVDGQIFTLTTDDLKKKIGALNASEVALIKVNNAVDSDKLGGNVADDYALKLDLEAMINDTTASGTTTYSSTKIDTLLAQPKRSPLFVNVQKVGQSDYTADKNDNDIRNYVNAGGIVKLRYEDQIFDYDKYQTGVGAVFKYDDINTEKAEKIRLTVKYDKKVVVERFTLDVYTKTEINEKNYQNANQVKAIKVDNATNSDKFATYDLETFKTNVIAKVKVDLAKNAEKLGGVLAEQYALKTDLTGLQNEEQVNQLIKNALEQIPFAEGGSF